MGLLLMARKLTESNTLLFIKLKTLRMGVFENVLQYKDNLTQEIH